MSKHLAEKNNSKEDNKVRSGKSNLLINGANNELRVVALCTVISTIISIVVAFIIFRSIDTTPATIEDFTPLYEAIYNFQDDPNYMFKTDCISVNSRVVTVANKECKLEAYFTWDDSRKSIVISHFSESDYCTNVDMAIFISIVFGLAIGFVSWIWLGEIYSVVKNTRKKNYNNV